jgi:hypothetical protein
MPDEYNLILIFAALAAFPAVALVHSRSVRSIPTQTTEAWISMRRYGILSTSRPEGREDWSPLLLDCRRQSSSGLGNEQF